MIMVGEGKSGEGKSGEGKSGEGKSGEGAGMIITSHQPIFCPWQGFFSKMRQVDSLVLLDDVQFPQGTTWLSRNRFKYHQGILWLTVPVWKKGRGLQRIQDVEICSEGNWVKKHLMALKMAYQNAPYWDDHGRFFDLLFSQGPSRLFELNLSIINYLKEAFHIPTPIHLSSSLQTESTGTERLVEICQKLGASEYLIQREGRKYLQEETFVKAGIKVNSFSFKHPIYPQLWGDFLPNLSAWDLLFNCGPKSEAILRRSVSQNSVS